MDIALWKRISEFTEVCNYPTLPCPHCNQVELSLDKESLQTRPVSEQALLTESRKYKSHKQKKASETEKTMAAIRKEDGFWLPLLYAVASTYQEYSDPISGQSHIFNSFFTCNHCKEHVCASGVLLRPLNSQQAGSTEKDVIKVQHFSPTVPIFALSANIPKVIGEELMDSFKHFHFDPPSSASKLRRAMERFCDDLRVEGNVLHHRIDKLAKTQPEEAKCLGTLKLVGNEGTHGTNVDELDLLYAFQMFQVVLEFYDRRARFESLQESYERLSSKFDKKLIGAVKQKERQNEKEPSAIIV